MAARTKSRKRALDVLYAAEMRGQDPVAALDAAIADGEGPTNPHTETLVRGVTEHRARIDELLSTYSHGWTLDRLPAVAVTEAVALVRDLSTDDSPAFVNGVLGSMLRDRDSITL